MRRQQFDNLIWQVPVITFAGQAFLFTVLLGPDTAWWARVITGAVSLGISYLSLLLLARHRQAEETLSAWLEDYEERHSWEDRHRQHGQKWADVRNKVRPVRSAKAPRTAWGLIPLLNGYKTWVVALYLLMAITVIATCFGLFFPPGAGQEHVPVPTETPMPTETSAPIVTPVESPPVPESTPAPAELPSPGP